jgi:hypothetical protein
MGGEEKFAYGAVAAAVSCRAALPGLVPTGARSVD